jgi:hypothetical protein
MNILHVPAPVGRKQATFNIAIHEKIARPFGKNDREKEHAAFEFGSNVPRHDALFHP